MTAGLPTTGRVLGAARLRASWPPKPGSLRALRVLAARGREAHASAGTLSLLFARIALGLAARGREAHASSAGTLSLLFARIALGIARALSALPG